MGSVRTLLHCVCLLHHPRPLHQARRALPGRSCSGRRWSCLPPSASGPPPLPRLRPEPGSPRGRSTAISAARRTCSLRPTARRRTGGWSWSRAHDGDKTLPPRERSARRGPPAGECGRADPAMTRMLLRRRDQGYLDDGSRDAAREFRDALQSIVASGKSDGLVRPGPADLWTSVWLALVAFAAERVSAKEWAPDHQQVGLTLEAAWDAIAAGRGREEKPEVRGEGPLSRLILLPQKRELSRTLRHAPDQLSAPGTASGQRPDLQHPRRPGSHRVRCPSAPGSRAARARMPGAPRRPDQAEVAGSPAQHDAGEHRVAQQHRQARVGCGELGRRHRTGLGFRGRRVEPVESLPGAHDDHGAVLAPARPARVPPPL